MTYTIRPASQDERDRFVRSTWRRSFARTRGHTVQGIGRYEYVSTRGDTGARVYRDLFLEMHGEAIRSLLGTGDAHVIVAALGDECLGWAAWSWGGQPHYVYVAPRFRRRGIGTALLLFARGKGAINAPTHLTYEGELLLSAVLRQQARSHTSQPEAAEVHDG